jgi:hypothetical protein
MQIDLFDQVPYQRAIFGMPRREGIFAFHVHVSHVKESPIISG